ncbi:DUF4440 domain-containing protein [Paracoccus pacificus]|uniref:DUF4440 domain-containing protein n=1 Tax=Paracoccus pacificus TaxID=1463598 RepID=A0ABW4R8G4_9RHOB
MADDAIWADEEAFWVLGAAEAGRRLDPACVMAFPQTGILQGQQILEALSRAPRWQAVDMTARHSAEGEGVVVIGYHAVARRADGEVYRAYCTSTWIRRGEDWRLIQHQQSPAGL